jgi:hypothetical protein
VSRGQSDPPKRLLFTSEAARARLGKTIRLSGIPCQGKSQGYRDFPLEYQLAELAVGYLYTYVAFTARVDFGDEFLLLKTFPEFSKNGPPKR